MRPIIVFHLFDVLPCPCIPFLGSLIAEIDHTIGGMYNFTNDTILAFDIVIGDTNYVVNDARITSVVMDIWVKLLVCLQ